MTNTIDKNLCFILEPRKIGSDGRSNVSELNTLYHDMIEPAVDGRGYRIVRSSHISHGDMVTRQHQNLIREAGLVIANITNADPVVLYCLAMRMPDPEQISHPDVITILERGAVNIFDVPGPFSDPIRFGIEPAMSFENDSAEETSRRAALLKARSDLTRAVQRLAGINRRGEERTAEAVSFARPKDDHNAETMAFSSAPPNTSQDAPQTENEAVVRKVMDAVLKAIDDPRGMRKIRDSLLDS